MTKKKITNKEAIERLKENISAITLYVTEAKLDEEEVENELLNIEILEMAIDALQFQDIMINNPKTAKPTPEICKNCNDNTQDDWVPLGHDSEAPGYEVMCQDRYENMMLGYAWVDEDGVWICEDDNVMMDDVVAWRPLPAPYKGE